MAQVTSSQNVSEEEVIRRKLLIEGDGGIDDKRIAAIIKSYTEWCFSEKDGGPGVNDKFFKKVTSELKKMEFSLDKGRLVHDMNLSEQNHYETLDLEIEAEIDAAATAVIDCKEELTAAKVVRRNRREYDAIATLIQKYPNRMDMIRKLEILEDDMKDLEAQQEKADAKLNFRKKQFHALLVAAHNLKGILAADQESGPSSSRSHFHLRSSSPTHEMEEGEEQAGDAADAMMTDATDTASDSLLTETTEDAATTAAGESTSR